MGGWLDGGVGMNKDESFTWAVFLPPLVTMLSELVGYWNAWKEFFSSSDFWDFLDDPEIRWSTDSELISIPNLDTPASEVDHLRGRGRLSHPLLPKGFHLQKFLPVKGWRVCIFYTVAAHEEITEDQGQEYCLSTDHLKQSWNTKHLIRF